LKPSGVSADLPFLIKFLAYLRGIETSSKSVNIRLENWFLAYLRGIETTVETVDFGKPQKFLAYLRGIETLYQHVYGFLVHRF